MTTQRAILYYFADGTTGFNNTNFKIVSRLDGPSTIHFYKGEIQRCWWDINDTPIIQHFPNEGFKTEFGETISQEEAELRFLAAGGISLWPEGWTAQ